ncbi:MAG: MCE family protein [Planctomycetes bacterium]|nr:MCE family protein [Planctomycetota bacterium]MCB9936396.1 MCE family protein [Planctomycetota bacterium]
MTADTTWDRKANLVSGVIALVGVACLAAWLAYVRVRDLPSEPPRTFVAYFENSGGLREGDRVRIQGRSAGHVTAVEVVMRDGKALTRVEFVIQPGSGSQWLAHEPIPADSRISVKMPSLLGRPQLVITVGDDDGNTIAEGGEWANTRSANENDQLTQWHEDLDRARGEITDFMAFFDDKQMFEDLNSQLAEVASALEEAERSVQAGVADAHQLEDRLQDATVGMTEARAKLSEQQESAAKGLSELADNTGRIEPELAKVNARLAGALDEVERMREATDKLSDTDQQQLDKLGLELRRMSARLRASMEVAKSDPSKAGDMPNWRRSRPFFSGGQPAAGTSIDEPPPEAPSEKVGVPKGNVTPKRVK